MAPPEQPEPMVYLIGPYASARCSLTIIKASAFSFALALVPWLVMTAAAVANPRDSELSSKLLLREPWVYWRPAPAPNRYSSLPFQAG